MKKICWLAITLVAVACILGAQISGVVSKNGGQIPNVAIPDFRGAGDAQRFMAVFNQTLWNDVQSSGVVKLVAKTMYPLTVPQQPSDFVQPPSPAAAPRGRNAPPPPQNGGGRWMSDWSNPPVAANYLAFGYTAVQNGVFLLRGWLFDLGRGTPVDAQMLAKNYTGSVDEAGARKTAHEFAADIIAQFGGKSLFGTHIYFVHQANARSPKEIWAMDWDGSNQRQLTHFNSTSIEPALSPDGSKIAFTSYAKGTPGIFVFSVDPVRDLHFYNQSASVNETPSFTPDGKQILYGSSAGGRCCRIFIANLDGSGFKPVTSSTFIDVEPKVNPKTGNDVVFVSGRSGPQQVYHMNIDGGDIERLSEGTGEASNPAWHPDGQIIAFSWTRGFAAGKFNIFTMDIATHKYLQLTHDEGRNENPAWAPDGAHLAFASTRGGSAQIWTMLADGSQQAQQLTRQGINQSPVWGK
jgi:TolB protein